MNDKRKYTKKNEAYWSSIGKKSDAPVSMIPLNTKDYEPSLVGSPFYVSAASGYVRNSSVVGNRTQKTNYGPRTTITDQYSNLDDLTVPFNYDGNGVASVKDPVVLCQKAYFHVPIFKNTIDVLSELSDADIVLSGGTKAARAFIKKWMESAKISAIKNQFFREYYRSGNVFLYRLFAEFSAAELASMKTIYAQNYELIPQDSGFPKNSLPMKYVMLNPMDIVNYEAIGGTAVYKKVLTKFETMRLKNPSTEEDKRLLEKIKAENGGKDIGLKSNQVYLSLEPERLIFTFYKKQDYEPFAIPFGHSVLRDINWKMELKKIDQSVSRSLENIILLITMGNDPDKGGINPRNLEAMKDLFSSEAVGRVLVADYTTKAQFVIPELGSILGAEKYTIVNQDIKEGLQNILFEDAKYSNSEIKVKVFYEKLKEGRKAFIDNFLQPEIKKVCSSMGFRDFPRARFRAATILNETDIQKAAVRLMELGVLPPKQGVESINTKELPDSSEIGEGQEEYKKQREDGQYVPLVGGVPLYQPEVENQPSAMSTAPKAGAPIKNPTNSRGRPPSSSIAKEESVSVKALTEVAKKATKFEEFAEDHIRKSKKLKKLSDEQKSVVKSLCGSIVESNDQKDWEGTFKECCSSSASIEKLNVKPEILDISAKYNVSTYDAALIYHSKSN